MLCIKTRGFYLLSYKGIPYIWNMIFKKQMVVRFSARLSLSAFVRKKKTVLLTVKYTQPYCGGARPTPEMVKAASEPKVYANKILVLFRIKAKQILAKQTKKVF